jgi:hypothetical protein
MSNQPAITRAQFAQLLGHCRQWSYRSRHLPPVTQRGRHHVIALPHAEAWIEAEIARHEAKADDLRAARAQLRATTNLERWRAA